jgi:predicted N-formylglutamate amidohydrolase
LLAADEPPALQVSGEHGPSALLLTCDHAGSLVPRALGTLGLGADELQRHIAWDIGAAALAMKLAHRLEACVMLQPYSRLVIDCNRPPGSAESIVAVSDGTRIPGNASVSAREAQGRERAIFRPYHARINAELDRRQGRRAPAILLAVHSFTPSLRGRSRPWHAGVLYHRDARFASALLQALSADRELLIGDNEPYSVDDQTDYTIPVHGEQRGLLHAGIEVRQDLIAEDRGQNEWAERLERALQRSVEQLRTRWPASLEIRRC